VTVAPFRKRYGQEGFLSKPALMAALLMTVFIGVNAQKIHYAPMGLAAESYANGVQTIHAVKFALTMKKFYAKSARPHLMYATGAAQGTDAHLKRRCTQPVAHSWSTRKL